MKGLKMELIWRGGGKQLEDLKKKKKIIAKLLQFNLVEKGLKRTYVILNALRKGQFNIFLMGKWWFIYARLVGGLNSMSNYVWVI